MVCRVWNLFMHNIEKGKTKVVYCSVSISYTGMFYEDHFLYWMFDDLIEDDDDGEIEEEDAAESEDELEGIDEDGDDHQDEEDADETDEDVNEEEEEEEDTLADFKNKVKQQKPSEKPEFS